jgi:hypothetical protein
MAQSVKPLNRKDAGLRTSEGRRCRLLGRKVYGVIVDAREPFVGDAPCTRPLPTSLLVTRVIDGFMARGGAPIAGDDTWALSTYGLLSCSSDRKVEDLYR